MIPPNSYIKDRRLAALSSSSLTNSNFGTFPKLARSVSTNSLWQGINASSAKSRASSLNLRQNNLHYHNIFKSANHRCRFGNKLARNSNGKINRKNGKIWSSLFNQKSKNYLLRSKIDQSITITNSNLSASFLGNRQMANHNTDDIKYCLNKIIDKNSTEPDANKLNVDLIFLKHQQKLNKRLLENSKY